MFCISDQKWMKKHSPFCQNQPLWRDTLAEVSSNHHTALKKKTANTVMATPQKLSVGCTLGTRKQRENQGTNSLRKQTHSRTLPAQSFFFKVRLVFLNNNHTHAHTHTHTHTHTQHTHTHLPSTQTELDMQNSYWSLWWTSEFWKKTSQPRVDASIGNDSILQQHMLQQTTLFWLKTGHWQTYITSRFPTGPLQIALHWLKVSHRAITDCWAAYITSRIQTWPLQTAEQPTSPQGFKHGHWRLLSVTSWFLTRPV